MNAKECRFCCHCDMSKANNTGQVRCKKFYAWVEPSYKCECFFESDVVLIEKCIKELLNAEN